MSKIIYDGGSWELTLNELILGIALFLLYLGLVFGGYTILDRYIENQNIEYISAVWIKDDETFKNRLETDSRNAFVYGEWKVTKPVDFIDWKTIFGNRIGKIPNIPTGKYSNVQIIKEHYTRHSRTVTYTVNGQTKIRTEYYYTWDSVWNYSLHSENISFCDIIFNYNAIKPSGINHRIDVIRQGNDRWLYYASDTSCSGIVYLRIEDKGIGTNNHMESFKTNTDEDFQYCVNAKLKGKFIRILYWIITVIIGITVVIILGVIDNDWLE